MSSESKITASLGSICSFLLSYWASTFMSSLRITILRVCHRIWLEGLQFKFYKHWSTSNNITWSIVIWNRRIFFWNSKTNQGLRWLIMEVVASWEREFIPTSNQDSIEHLKLYLAFHTRLLSISGPSAQLLPSFTQVFRYSLVKMKSNNWLTSWRFMINQIPKFWNLLKDHIYSSIRKINQN